MVVLGEANDERDDDNADRDADQEEIDSCSVDVAHSSEMSDALADTMSLVGRSLSLPPS